MKADKTFAITVTRIMFLTLTYGFTAGIFFKEGSILFSKVWGSRR